ncbi:Dual specificity protein kinase [Venturia nashicola]|nr:Dual specificity protein kinase [Venturia nashicola]
MQPTTLTLQRGHAGDAKDIAELSSVVNGYYHDFVPDPELEDGDDYLLRLSQGTIEDFSPVFAVYGGRKATRTTSSSLSLFATGSSILATSTRSAAATTFYVAGAPLAGSAQTTSSTFNPVKIIVPTPTSSFDAPRQEDRHLTINDKFALGFGIPIILIVLSTLGYWRAIKYFLHRKVTGGAKLPVYGPDDNARAASNFRPRGSWSSRPGSLWGAASRRGSVAPPIVQIAFSDSTELCTGPKITRTTDDARPSQGPLRVPSTLRQEWRDPLTKLTNSLKMSAPNQGRQSPEPETQTDAQTGQQAQPNDQKADTEKSSDPKETLKGLESNPEHILAKSAKEKTSKQ